MEWTTRAANHLWESIFGSSKSHLGVVFSCEHLEVRALVSTPVSPGLDKTIYGAFFNPLYSNDYVAYEFAAAGGNGGIWSLSDMQIISANSASTGGIWLGSVALSTETASSISYSGNFLTDQNGNELTWSFHQTFNDPTSALVSGNYSTYRVNFSGQINISSEGNYFFNIPMQMEQL